jgi:hypothetical protein
MWSKLLEQLPAALLAAVVTIAALLGSTYWIRQKVVDEVGSRNRAEILRLQQEQQAALAALRDQMQRQMDATYTLLKSSVEGRRGELFMSDDELARLNAEKVAILADAIAAKMQPYGVPIPRTAGDAEDLRNRQVEEVAGRLAGRIQPILEQMGREQTLTQESIQQYGERISDQISVVLTQELAAKQQLNNNVLETAAIAQESMRLTQELTSLYLSQMQDSSVLGRILTLPARVIQDTARGNIVNSADRRRTEERIVGEMEELQRRLDAVRAAMPGTVTP